MRVLRCIAMQNVLCKAIFTVVQRCGLATHAPIDIIIIIITAAQKGEKRKRIRRFLLLPLLALSLSLSQGFRAAAAISAQEGDAFIDTMSSTGSRERTLVVGQAIAGHLHHDDYQLVERLRQRLIVRAYTKSNERRQHFSILLSVTDIQRVLLIVCLYVRVDNFVRE